MSKKTLFLSILAASILLLATFLLGCSKTDPAKKPMGNGGTISSAEAAAIALQEYPQGKVKTVTLEEESGSYYYQVTLIEGEAEYSLAIDLTTGLVLAKYQQNPSAEAPLLTLEAIAQLAKNAVPEGKITELSLEAEDQFYFYKAELLAGEIEHTLYFQSTTGEIIQSSQAPLTSQLDLGSYLSFEEVFKEIARLMPDGYLVQLELDEDQPLPTYEATLLAGGQTHEIELDAKTGEMIKKEASISDPKDYPPALWPYALSSNPATNPLPESLAPKA